MVKRVLMTADAVGGVWTYSLDLCRYLGENGVEVALATMGPPPSPEQRLEAQEVPGLRLFVGEFKLEWQKDPWEDVGRAGRWLLDLEQRFRPDVVHLNGFCHGELPWRAPVLSVFHSCVLSWWRSVKKCEAPAEWDVYRSAVVRGLRAAGEVVAPSQWMLREAATLYGPFARAKVIHNGRDLAPFRPGKKAEIVLAAGRLWDEAKNVSVVEQVADRLPWPVQIAGEGKTSGKAIRLGRISTSELADRMSRSSVFVHPARYEPFGLTVLEAAISGCALVLGDIPSLRENWEGSACFVSPDEPDVLAATLQRLIGDKAELARLAAAAQQRAKRFSLASMGDSYLGTYRALVEPEVVAARKGFSLQPSTSPVAGAEVL